MVQKSTTALKDTYVDLMHKEFLFSPKELNLSRDKVHLHMWVNRYTGDHHIVHTIIKVLKYQEHFM